MVRPGEAESDLSLDQADALPTAAPDGPAPAPPKKKKKEKTEKEVQAEIRDIIKQITASVTFLPTLEEPCELGLSLLLPPTLPPALPSSSREVLLQCAGESVSGLMISPFGPGTFTLLAYTSTSEPLQISDKWTDADPHLIDKGKVEQVRLRSFSTNVHRLEVRCAWGVGDLARVWS